MFGIITLITALSLAGTAAWFAVAGIMAVFAGAPIPALIMGAVIETGKIVGVSWAYRNWHAKTKLKWAVLPLIAVAMILTSMGIFGFLSKAHIEQNAPVGNNTLKIERLDQRVNREQSRILDAETVIQQLDNQVKTLIEYDKISGPDGSRAVRAGQREQRDALAQEIDEAQDRIDEYEDQKLELSQELKELELEVGPVKYIAELIYDDPENSLEDAVRIVIIAFIFVFDPMAIILLMAANYTLMKTPKKEDQQSPVSNIVPTAESSFTPAKEINSPPVQEAKVPPKTIKHTGTRAGKFVSRDKNNLKHKTIGDNNDKQDRL